MDLTPCVAPFTDAAWVFELLPRGLRMLAGASVDAPRLRSRHGADTTERFGDIAAALRAPALNGAIFDGEVCAFDHAGRLDRERLHRRATQRRPDVDDGPLTYCIFDLLAFGGRDLRALPWTARRALLSSLQIAQYARLQLQRALPVQGEWLHRQAAVLGSPGVAARRRDAPYSAGPSADWRWISSAGAAGASR